MNTNKELATPLLSICVPVYDEEENLPLLHAAICEVCDPLGATFELLLVDDGSKDGSWGAIEKLCAKDARVRGLKFKFNCGETAASDAGLRAAVGKYVMTMDADLQNDPKDIPAFLKALEDPSVDCVCGTRVADRARGDDKLKVISSRVANWVRNSVLQDQVTDAGCTYRCMRRECIRDLKLYRGLHRFIPTLLKMEGYKVVEVAVSNNPRVHGESKYGMWNRLFKSFRDMLAIRWMKQRWLGYEVGERL
ncbi:MAG TPA: glycosyltransferase family 2 protein [Tepidisphaeraceae bacterium]|jgi:glycosyltransferase involved in cell wall biosynthesis|nr:glycosyltransferase family 2 protein [Tepidisphaeraceae bacterium]